MQSAQRGIMKLVPRLSHLRTELCCQVYTIKALADNYQYLVVDSFTTHHHHDHSGGNAELHRCCPSLPIYGSPTEFTPGATVKMTKPVTIGNLTVTPHGAAPHTKGHVMLFVQSKQPDDGHPILFTGDTLFVGGCGRFFEGTAADMHQVALDLHKFPSDTRVFCGHEYTLSNVKFILSLMEGDKIAEEMYNYSLECQAKDIPTVPGTLELERCYNPFLRTSEPEVRRLVGGTDPVDALAKLRKLKDAFRAETWRPSDSVNSIV